MKDFDTSWYNAHLDKNKLADSKSPEQMPADAVELESTLHDDIIAECRQRGWIVIHSRMDVPTTTAVGVPDFIIFASEGRVFLFECKSKTGKETTEQKGFAIMAEMLGFKVHLIRAKSEFLKVINA